MGNEIAMLRTKDVLVLNAKISPKSQNFLNYVVTLLDFKFAMHNRSTFDFKIFLLISEIGVEIVLNINQPQGLNAHVSLRR